MSRKVARCLSSARASLPGTRSPWLAGSRGQQRWRRPQRPATRAVSSPERTAPGEEAVAKLTGAAGREVLQLYRYPGLPQSKARTLLRKAQDKASSKIAGVDGELCYNIATSAPLSPAEARTLAWLLRETYEPELLTPASRFSEPAGDDTVVEVGPRMSFSTAWCANALSICQSCGLGKVSRIEVSRRYLLRASAPLSAAERERFAALVHDRMTEQVYAEPLHSYATDAAPAPVHTIPVLAQGRAALEAINKEMGLAFDEWDLDYYTAMFRRAPLGGGGSGGRGGGGGWGWGGDWGVCAQIAAMRPPMFEKGVTYPPVLFVHMPRDARIAEMVAGALAALAKAGTPAAEVRVGPRSVTADWLAAQDELQRDPTNVELFDIAQSNSEHSRHWFFKADLIIDGEKAPENLMDIVKSTLDANNGNSGAETGAGGRIRDTHATGIGSIMGAATAGYCTGNLHIDGYELPWEDPSFEYPASLAPPLQILIDASNGASGAARPDYGNKFGEPLVAGYTRTYGQRLPGGERREWIKPIMFRRGAAAITAAFGGLGQIDHGHLRKADPELGMLVVKIGSPAYRIGMGGGAASSVPSGSNSADLDFNAVQRGDAEMSQKLWRVVRACVEMGPANPIEQIHDQGAGGNCNVVKEIIYPLGAQIDVRAVRLGDATLSVLEIWGAEFDRKAGATAPLALPGGATVAQTLDHVLRLPAVGSKRFLTTKARVVVVVDRHVTGLIAQQQCCGPLQLPVADVAVMAQTHFGLTGAATAIGEQPIKGLISPQAMARLALGEALTNLVWARATSLRDVKASVNWMYAGNETVKAPGNLVVSAYVTCPDITQARARADSARPHGPRARLSHRRALVVTPDLKAPGSGRLLHVDLAAGRRRLGGSTLAQARACASAARPPAPPGPLSVYGQLGDDCPDVEPAALRAAWEVTQRLIAEGLLLAGHDVSDGGIATAVLEMAFAGNTGVSVDLPPPARDPHGAHAALFAEELGLVLEVAPEHEAAVLAAYAAAGVPAAAIGATRADAAVSLSVGGREVVSSTCPALRDVWEATSFQLERLQARAKGHGLAGTVSR
eukprot:scaffold26.g3357.t1